MAASNQAVSGMAFGPNRPIDWPAALKESGLVAFITLGLSVLMVGIEVRDVPGGLKLIGRYGDVAFACLFGFLGRLALILLRNGRPRPVFAICAPLSLVLVLILMSQTIVGLLSSIGLDLGVSADSKALQALKAALPFQSLVVMWIVTVVIFVFVFRAYRMISADGHLAAAEQREEEGDRIGAAIQRVSRFLGPTLIVVALLLPIMAWPDVRVFLKAALPFLPAVDLQVMDIAILVVTYIMLGWGLNIVVGLAGLLDLGYVAFYAVGAYSYALLAQHAGLGFWACLPFAGLMAATAGVILGFPVLRLRGDYLAIVTLGFGEMIRVILLNWYSLTRGPDGIGGIPRPSFFGLPFKRYPAEGTESFHTFLGVEFNTIHRYIFLYLLILVLALITNFFTLRIRKLPVGRAWEALREDEIACRSLGINPTNTKLTAFGIGAMFGGFAGSFFATRQGFISPESFTFIESAIILAIVVLGGMGSQIGVVFAAIILIGLPEIFRELQQYRMLFFGGAMVLIMLWRPSGLLAHREPTIRLSKGRRDPAAEVAE